MSITREELRQLAWELIRNYPWSIHLINHYYDK